MGGVRRYHRWSGGLFDRARRPPSKEIGPRSRRLGRGSEGSEPYQRGLQSNDDTSSTLLGILMKICRHLGTTLG